MSKFYRSYNLEELNLLPKNWAEQVKIVADEHSYKVHLDGKSSTSREPDNTKGVDLSIVEGDKIKENLPWLYSLYCTEFIEMANKLSQKKYAISLDEKIGLNINYLIGNGARYEWHVDDNPLTGLLFVTSHPQGTGGELVFKDENMEEIVYPQKGILLLFDARKVPHAVLPLKSNTHRISIPINFYIENEKQSRPSDLDNYLYRRGEKQNEKEF